jgi:antirestriction protein ArdC
MSKKRSDIHQHVTDRIIAAIEARAGKRQMLCHRGSGGKSPVNVESDKPIGASTSWPSRSKRRSTAIPRTWKGAIVRKGQKASYVVFYKEIEVGIGEGDENDSRRRLITRAAPVFNADQVDDLTEVPAVESTTTALPNVDAFITTTGATIVHAGSRAYYIPRPENHARFRKFAHRTALASHVCR